MMENLRQGRPNTAETDLLAYAASLVAGIDRAWSAHSYCAENFIELAQEALNRAQPHRTIDLDAALPRLVSAPELPTQIDAARVSGPLSKCSVTLFANDRLQADLNIWFVVPMIVHDHNYHAAFAPLRGQSFEERFAWTPDASSPDGLDTGQLTASARRWLAPGDISTLTPFDGCIHRVWHLDFPSASLFINTRAQGGPAGRSFDQSGLAFPYPLTPTLPIGDMKRVHIYESALRNGIGDPMSCLAAAAEEASPLTLFHLLQRMLLLEPPVKHWSHLDAIAETRLPGLGARFSTYRDGQARWCAVDWARRGEHDENIALAALMTAANPAALAEFLHGTPLRTHRRFAKALEAAQAQALLTAPLPELAFDILPDLLEGATDAKVVQGLAERYGAKAADATTTEIQDLCRQMRQSVLLGPVIPGLSA